MVSVIGYLYSKTLEFYIYIKYKISLRKLQETKEKVICSKIFGEYQNNILYNCSFKTNGEDIDNLEVKTILEEYDFIGQNVEFIIASPFAIKYMDNLQNVGNGDLFNKKVYILDKSIISINNKNWNVEITGVMNDKAFKYSRLNLTIALLSSNSKEIIENITCTTEKLYKENDSLNCFAENEMSGELESASSDLGKDILLVNFLNNSNNKIDFVSRGNRFYKQSRKGLSAGTITAIVLVLTFGLICICGIFLILSKKKDKKYIKEKEIESSSYIMKVPTS